jgi:predicted NAD/FAD-dependent oxidoreductase
MAGLDRDTVYEAFARAVNMRPAELEAWLATEESRKVGWKPDGGESVGHASGRRIVAIARKAKAALDDEDYRHMRKVAGFVARHRAQRPENVVTSRWRYSLMNWGHDPLKDEAI